MEGLFVEYFLLVFIASSGVLQLAAAHSQLKGLLFFKRITLTYAFATLTIGSAFGWFFGWDNRLQEKIMRTGLEGAEQFYYFLLAAFTTLVFTIIISSIVNRQPLIKAELKGQGLDILKEGNYFQALRYSFKKGTKKQQKCTK